MAVLPVVSFTFASTQASIITLNNARGVVLFTSCYGPTVMLEIHTRLLKPSVKLRLAHVEATNITAC